MPDRAQDTEAIRAALAFGRARAIATVIADNPPAHTLADEVAVETAQFDDAIVKFGRLVARLEAAERALLANVGDAYNLLTQGESSTQRRAPSAQRIYDRSRAALAAAAPGECDGSPTCAADEHVENCVAGWATGAAPGETTLAEPAADGDAQWCGDDRPHEPHPWSDVFCPGAAPGETAQTP